MEYKVKTWVSDGNICQEISTEIDSVCRVISSTIMNAREQGVKNALIRLGWTPPLDAENPNENIGAILDLIIEAKSHFASAQTIPAMRKITDLAFKAQIALENILAQQQPLRDEVIGLRHRLRHLMEMERSTLPEPAQKDESKTL